MVTYIIGDATDPRSSGPKIIAHVCNDIGGWGRGFVLAVSQRWKLPETEYRAWAAGQRKLFYLSAVQFVNVEPNLWVANMIAQHDIVTTHGIPPIRYDALRDALKKVKTFAAQIGASVHLPRIGCGLAGGTWDMVRPIIENELEGLKVYIYDLPRELTNDRV